QSSFVTTKHTNNPARPLTATKISRGVPRAFHVQSRAFGGLRKEFLSQRRKAAKRRVGRGSVGFMIRSLPGSDKKYQELRNGTPLRLCGFARDLKSGF